MFTINADASRVFRIKIVDAKGRAAKVDGIPAWDAQPAGFVQLTPADDGMSCNVLNLQPNDGVGLTVNADADLGAGVRAITGTATLQLLGAEAAAIELSADEEVAG